MILEWSWDFLESNLGQKPVYRNIAPRPMVIPAVHTDEGRDDHGAGGYISVYGLLTQVAFQKVSRPLQNLQISRSRVENRALGRHKRIFGVVFLRTRRQNGALGRDRAEGRLGLTPQNRAGARRKRNSGLTA